MTPDDESLVLELLNTTPVVNGVVTDALAEPGQAASWLRAHGGNGSADELARVRQARDALRGVALGEHSSDLLARFLRSTALSPTVTEGRLRWRVDAPPGELLAARAVLAWFALEEARPGRLRPCANPDCRHFLIDRSHANRAQWCSMAVCGNRMKARRHYERKRADETRPG